MNIESVMVVPQCAVCARTCTWLHPHYCIHLTYMEGSSHCDYAPEWHMLVDFAQSREKHVPTATQHYCGACSWFSLVGLSFWVQYLCLLAYSGCVGVIFIDKFVMSVCRWHCFWRWTHGCEWEDPDWRHFDRGTKLSGSGLEQRRGERNKNCVLNSEAALSILVELHRPSLIVRVCCCHSWMPCLHLPSIYILGYSDTDTCVCVSNRTNVLT